MKFGFAEPTAGHKPVAENEVIADTKTLELMGVPLEVGAPVTLNLTVHGRQVQRDFILAGWWKSDPGFNIGQIFASRAYVDAHLDELQNTYYKDSSLTGAITGYIKFKNSLNIEKNLETVLAKSGYSMDKSMPNYIATGINWAYMSTGTKIDAGTALGLLCAMSLFVFAGYLIIYNIFQISVLKDIRFYGLLKTIGTTNHQLRAIIRHQAMLLSLIGIPSGLLADFFVGKAFVPTLMVRSSYAGSAVSVSPHPLIFAGTAAFALVTVFISTYKPGKIAAKVSPVEAIGYSEVSQTKLKKHKRSTSGARPHRMALSNLGRNKKRTVLVTLSLSLSIVLVNTVFTFSQSIDVSKALQKFNASDFLIGHADLFNHKYNGADSALSESFIDLVDGEFDDAKLAPGNYILEGVKADDNGNAEMDSFNHKVGDKIILKCKDSVKEMTVLGHVIANLDTNTDGSWRGSAFYLPTDVFKELTGIKYAMSYAFDVAYDHEPDMETFLKQYTDSVEPTMSYTSKSTALSGLEGIQNTAILVGGVLAMIIGLIGILNFINAVLTSILIRRREFAMLQSIGMSKQQLRKMLVLEGLWYAVIAAMLSLIFSTVASSLLVRPIAASMRFCTFTFTLKPVIIVVPFYFLAGALVPLFAAMKNNKASLVEQIRQIE